jgi:3-hydroxyisobutyrate dehydrogenase-like beta-hydroxyacid dehydrogenase
MNVAIAGLGLMGTAIAERMEEAGHQLVLYNRTSSKCASFAERGALVVDQPSDLWTHAKVVVTMVSDSAALEATVLGDGGLADERGRGGLLIDMSTVSAESSARVAGAAGRTGIAYVRAPVSGNPAVVRAGALGIIASGPSDAFAEAERVLRDIGPNIFYLGDGEVARVMKLALNLMVAGTTELLAESLCLGEAHGLERAKMLEVIGGSAVGSPLVKYKSGALIADDYTSTFTSRLMRKDLDLALASGAEAGVPLPVTAIVQQLLLGCISSGMGDIDFASLLPRLKREAGEDVAPVALSS